MAQVQRVEIIVEALGVVVVNVVIALEEGVYGGIELVGQRVGHGRGREGGIQSFQGLAHRPARVSGAATRPDIGAAAYPDMILSCCLSPPAVDAAGRCGRCAVYKNYGCRSKHVTAHAGPVWGAKAF
jgi:hypothetical protein